VAARADAPASSPRRKPVVYPPPGDGARRGHDCTLSVACRRLLNRVCERALSGVPMLLMSLRFRLPQARGLKAESDVKINAPRANSNRTTCTFIFRARLLPPHIAATPSENDAVLESSPGDGRPPRRLAHAACPSGTGVPRCGSLRPSREQGGAACDADVERVWWVRRQGKEEA
jgi:hypothetical protein